MASIDGYEACKVYALHARWTCESRFIVMRRAECAEKRKKLEMIDFKNRWYKSLNLMIRFYATNHHRGNLFIIANNNWVLRDAISTQEKIYEISPYDLGE